MFRFCYVLEKCWFYVIVILEAVIFDAAELYCIILYFICPIYIKSGQKIE